MVDPTQARRAKHARRTSKLALAKERARVQFLDVTAPMRSKVMGSLKDAIKLGVLADPDMWPSVRNASTAVLDQLLSDIEHEIERNLHMAMLQQKEDADAPGPSGRFFCWWYWIRAKVLYHYLPHDKRFFGRLKDPLYLFIYFLTLVPIHGVRILVFTVVLAMLVCPGKPDEYQLINFILLCKGMQFFTSGLIQLAAGAVKYYVCYSLQKDHVGECIDRHGPGASDGFGLACDYLGSITLVWVAFWLLSRSEKHAQDRYTEKTWEDREKAEQAGGRLRSLLYYDRKCFLSSLLLLLFLTVCTCSHHIFSRGLSGFRFLAADPQFSENIFWCCVVYSILSLPFAPFMISGLQEVMTHCFATGFNKHGACVSFGLLEEEEEGKPHPNHSIDKFMNGATSILHTLNRGRALRGGDDHALEYQFGDFSRGLWARVTGQGRPHEKAVAAPGAASTAATPRAAAPSATSTETAGPVPSADLRRQDEEGRRSGCERTLWCWSNVRRAHREDAAEAPVSAEAQKRPDYVEHDQDDPLHTVVSVRIPATIEQDGHNFFHVEVFPDRSLDAESGQEAWEVLRRYRDFRKLANLLGPQAHSYHNAQFPKKTWGKCHGTDLEERRQGLERWLACVVQDAFVQDGCARHLHDFLKAEKYPDNSESDKKGTAVFVDLIEETRKARGTDYMKFQASDLMRGFFVKHHRHLLPPELPRSLGVPRVQDAVRYPPLLSHQEGQQDCIGGTLNSAFF